MQDSPNPELWDFELMSDKRKRSMKHMSVTIFLLQHFMDALEMETKHFLYPKIFGYLTRAHLVFKKFAEDYLQLIMLSYSFLMTMSRKAYNATLKN